MSEGQKKKGWRRILCTPQSNTSIYVAAFFVLAAGAVAEAASSTEGFAIETSGMKISLQFATPEGAKLTFQRADYLHH